MTGNDIEERWLIALIADVCSPQLGASEQQRHREMTNAARRGRICKPIGLSADVIDEIPNGFHRDFCIHNQGKWVCADFTDRDEITDRVIGDLGRRGRYGDLGRESTKQRVPIALRTRNRFGRDDTIRPGAVFDDEWLTEG